MKKKGNITLYLVFMFAAIILVVIAAVIAPLGVLINTKFYAAGEDIMLRANSSVSKIQNATVRDKLNGIYGNSLGSIDNNIEVNNSLFQYSWIVVLILGGLIVFLFTRAMVEYGQGGLA